MSAVRTTSEVMELIDTQLIRELVERYPAVMPVLSRYGFDLCCGGGHTVPEAVSLHGLKAEPVMAEVAYAILSERD